MTETMNPDLAAAQAPPAQDLHLATPAHPDPGMPGFDAPRADAARLAKSSEWVTVTNTSPVQTHIVFDRYKQGHELLPGQSQRFEMVCSEVDYFLQQRVPHSVTSIVDGKVLSVVKQHPIEIRDAQGAPIRNLEKRASIAAAEDAHDQEASKQRDEELIRHTVETQSVMREAVRPPEPLQAAPAPPPAPPVQEAAAPPPSIKRTFRK